MSPILNITQYSYIFSNYCTLMNPTMIPYNVTSRVSDTGACYCGYFVVPGILGEGSFFQLM